MKSANTLVLTREKHLDHMVRVVPFIVFCYAIQCYFIIKISPTEFSRICLSVLGGFLACMISAFITYDLKHQAEFTENELRFSFFTMNETIKFEDITFIELGDPDQSFSTLILHTTYGKKTFYFVDDAKKIKMWIESRKESQLMAA